MIEKLKKELSIEDFMCDWTDLRHYTFPNEERFMDKLNEVIDHLNTQEVRDNCEDPIRVRVLKLEKHLFWATDPTPWTEPIIAFVLAMNNWTPEFPRWRGNGYVAIPPSHPLYWKHYDDVSIDVHWGLTYSGNASDLRQGGIVWDYRILGFDTAHADDDLHTRPRQKVVEETLRLKTIVDGLSMWPNVTLSWTEPISRPIRNNFWAEMKWYTKEELERMVQCSTPQTEPIESPIEEKKTYQDWLKKGKALAVANLELMLGGGICIYGSRVVKNEDLRNWRKTMLDSERDKPVSPPLESKYEDFGKELLEHLYKTGHENRHVVWILIDQIHKALE